MNLDRRFITYVGVGIINTIVDISILLALTKLIGLPVIMANIFSTTVALAVSYILNGKFTFDANQLTAPGKIATFIGITLTGLWILQPLLILGSQAALNHASYSLIVGKVLAIFVTTIWNYYWYHTHIFAED